MAVLPATPFVYAPKTGRRYAELFNIIYYTPALGGSPTILSHPEPWRQVLLFCLRNRIKSAAPCQVFSCGCMRTIFWPKTNHGMMVMVSTPWNIGSVSHWGSSSLDGKNDRKNMKGPCWWAFTANLLVFHLSEQIGAPIAFEAMFGGPTGRDK